MKKFLGLILLMLLPCSTLSMWGQTGQQMKLISYNIWNGFEGDSLRRARFIEWTRKQAADIFVLTELVGFKEKDLKTLGQVCGYPYAAIVKEEGYPVGVLSKQPIEVIKKQVEGFENIGAGVWVSVCCHCEGRGVSCRSAFQATDRSD